MQHLLSEFRSLPDYRKCKQLKYNVGETLFLALLAVMAGANGFEDMAIWIKSKAHKLRKFLNRPFIPPAYTTIRNVFLYIDMQAVEALFQKWSHQTANASMPSLNIVAADGKTLRGSSDKVGNERARHIVSLFLTQKKLTLAQMDVEDKTNEISALLELLEALELQNCIITVDAMHTQKKHYRPSLAKATTL